MKINDDGTIDLELAQDMTQRAAFEALAQAERDRYPLIMVSSSGFSGTGAVYSVVQSMEPGATSIWIRNRERGGGRTWFPANVDATYWAGVEVIQCAALLPTSHGYRV